MNEHKRKAVVMLLLRGLRDNESWGGETHLQKATYLLQDIFNLPIGYGFVLYKHGPFCFDLRDEIAEMRAEGLVEMEIQEAPYGPKLMVTRDGEGYLRKFPRTDANYGGKIRLVAENLGGKNVIELEAIATAFYVISNTEKSREKEREVASIRELKPHISEEGAESALAFVDEMLELSQ